MHKKGDHARKAKKPRNSKRVTKNNMSLETVEAVTQAAAMLMIEASKKKKIWVVNTMFLTIPDPTQWNKWATWYMIGTPIKNDGWSSVQNVARPWKRLAKWEPRKNQHHNTRAIVWCW
jgi:hypothetical protein